MVTILTEKLAYYHDDLLAVNLNLMVYYTFGENQELVLNEYDFDSRSREIISDTNVTLDYSHSSLIALYDGFIDYKRTILLYADSKTYKYFRAKWVNLDKNYFYRRDGAAALIRSDTVGQFYLRGK